MRAGNEPLIVLYKPQIPPNTGNVARLCVGIDLPLTILGRPAFSLDEKSLKRAGLDYWEHLRFSHEIRFKNFWRENLNRRKIMFSKESDTNLWDFEFDPNDILIFGNETAGLPPKLLKMGDKTVKIPMRGMVRSLNLSNAVSIVSYECLRQLSMKGLYEFDNKKEYKRMYYKKKST
ncbi:MAG: tRNA (cytidine(34)-2'-O)-methyltransferase, partial [Spirochaetia bacterium]|nr:tRNA (cytidine(34)-2'-O)-methyltransferase [Spirochaetia bacterium]